jgi:hypothetical protein
MLDEVMEPFFTTRTSQGDCLGLSMVYGFARQSGGAIRIESRVATVPGRNLAAPSARRQSGVGPKRARRPPTASPPSPRRGSAYCWSTIISESGRPPPLCSRISGHRVTQAGDGPEMLDLLKDNSRGVRPDHSDYAMPRLSGAEVVRRARAIRPKCPRS